MDMKLDFALLHATLYYGSRAAQVLSSAEHDEVFAMLDGYGRMSLQQLRQLGLTWDWSHVRDATDEAIEAAAARVRELLEGKTEAQRIEVEACVQEVWASYPVSWEAAQA